MPRMRIRLSLAAALVAVVAPGPASADGLPVIKAPRPVGLVSLGGAARYATVAEAGGTVVLKLERDGGHVFASGFLHGRFGVPVVA
jgi:hypothetical protein